MKVTTEMVTRDEKEEEEGAHSSALLPIAKPSHSLWVSIGGDDDNDGDDNGASDDALIPVTMANIVIVKRLTVQHCCP